MAQGAAKAMLLLLATTAGCLEFVGDPDVPTGAIDGIMFFVDPDTESGASQPVPYRLRGNAEGSTRDGPGWVAFAGRMTVRVFAQVPANDCLPEEERLVLAHNVTFAPGDFQVVEEPAFAPDGKRFAVRNAILLGELPAYQFVNSGTYRFEAMVMVEGGATYTESKSEWFRNPFPELKEVPRDGAPGLGSLSVTSEGGSHAIHLRGATADASWSSDCSFSAQVHIDVERRDWSTSPTTYDRTGEDDFVIEHTQFRRDFFGAFYEHLLPDSALPDQDSYRLTVKATLADGRVVSTQGEFTLGRDP
jgi:hypothetical protein